MNQKLEMESAFELVAKDKRCGRYQAFSFIMVAACQILLAFQMCMMVVLKPRLTTQSGLIFEN